jgi:DNA-binding transcriptional MerR regulator
VDIRGDDYRVRLDNGKLVDVSKRTVVPLLAEEEQRRDAAVNGWAAAAFRPAVECRHPRHGLGAVPLPGPYVRVSRPSAGRRASVPIQSSSTSATRRPSARRVARLAGRRATGGVAVLPPKDVCSQLTVSASTLRAWSTEFKDYLSPAAQVGPAAGRAHRRYTAADVQVLARIGHLLHLGHRCDEVKQLLPPPPSRNAEHAASPPTKTEDAERDGRLRSLEDALTRARREVGSLEEQAVRHERQLRAEQAAHAETRRALLEVQRKLAEAQRVNTRFQEANRGLHAQVARLEDQVNAPVWKRVFQ